MKKIFNFAKKKRGASPSASETGSLTSAAGYELRERDLSKLHRAACAGDLAKLRQLCRKQDPNQLDKERRTPLHLACANGHPELVSCLIENKSKLNLCDNDSRSPLMKAIQCQQERCATILLEYDADTNLVDINGNTALHFSALIPSVSLATQLLDHDAHIDAQNKDGSTPLLLAVTENHDDMVEFLLKQGADINAKDKSKRTPLMIAAGNGQISLVKLLVQNDVDVTIKDDKGCTADDYAVMNGHHACSHLIIEHGSKQKFKTTPAYHGNNKVKGVSMFSSPERAIDGFPLGGPAADRDVTEDTSQVESESRDSNKARSIDSWTSSDEDVEPDFTPKKSKKPSLTELMNASMQTKKAVHDATSIIKMQPLASAQDSKSVSEEDLYHDSDDEEPRSRSPPKPLSRAPSFPHPAFVSPGSLPPPIQMASSPPLGFKQDDTEEDSRDLRENPAMPSMYLEDTEPPANDTASNLGSTAGRKVLMSELGLEDDDAESAWDSESASESPRKQTTPLPAANTQMQSISEEKSEDDSIKPTVQKPMTLLASFDTDTQVVSKPTFTESVKRQKSDLMEEFGLDDADDIEDASDWDSTSASPKQGKGFAVLHTDETATKELPLILTSKRKQIALPDAAGNGFPTIPAPAECKTDITTDFSRSRSEHIPESNMHALKTHRIPLDPKPAGEEGIGSTEPPLEQLSSKDMPANNVNENSQQKVEEEKLKSTQSQKWDEMEKLPARNDGDNHIVQNTTSHDKNHDLKQTVHPKFNTLSDNEGGTFQSTPTVSTKEKLKAAQSLLKRKPVSPDRENLKNGRKNQTKRSTKPTSARPLNYQPVSAVYGNAIQGFDDSTFSETSQDEERSNSKSGNKKEKVIRQVDLADDLEDFTLSSDTATEDCDSPTSAYRNAMLLIKQLGVEGQDSVSLLKFENIVHEYERLIEKENGRYKLLLEKVKTLESERKSLQKIIEETRELKSSLEHQKVEWESDLNSVRFTLKQEEEKRKSSEMLYEKCKDQLRKKEDQCCKEMEVKQQHELNLRNMELELRTLRNSLKQVEEERSEAQRLLSQERSARAVQEGIWNKHLWKQKEEDEKTKMITKRDECLPQMTDISDREKELSQKNHSLQDEINVLKTELDQIRVRKQEEEGNVLEENEALKEKLEDLRRDLKLNEEALTQTVYQYNGQFNALKAETTMLSSKMEHEKESKDRLETELESVRSRLASALQELERSQTSKSDAERTFQRERDDWLRSQDKVNYDLASVRESNSTLSQQLTKAEAKANSLENELHRTTLSLREKVILLETAQRDLNQTQCRVKELECNLQIEKDQISKSTVKQETMQERLSQIHSENMLLRQQLEDVQNKGILKEKAVNETQDRFSEIFNKLREDTEKKVQMVEDRNKELITKTNDLREQIYKIESEKIEREAELRQVQQELVDALKKKSMSEASLEVTIQKRNDLEEEKLQLLNEIDKLKSKIQDYEERYIQSEHRIQELKAMLGDKEREVLTVSHKLHEFSTVSSGAERTVKQLEEHVQKLEIENARLEAATNQQAGRIEILQKEQHETVAVRTRLEDLITNLQSTKIGLEEQLNQQVHQHTVLSQTAKDSHNLWEEELRSRSRIGVRLAQLDKEKAELTDQYESERKKLKKVVDMKRSLESRLDQEMKRNTELQKEANGMKKLLKLAKKKLKDYESGELGSQLSTSHGELKNNQYEAENQMIRLKSKIDELSQNLEVESLKCSKLESTNRDLWEQLSSLKGTLKNHERLEKSKQQLEEELANLKSHIETNMVDHNQIGQYKREIEERARQEIRQKLDEVNMFLQTQAASQETLEQIRASNDASLRNQMEHRIRELESELSRIKSTQQENMSQKESTQTELERYKTLYSEEIKVRRSLASKLERSNERLAEANTKLLTERQRSKTLIANSFVNGNLSASPYMDTSQLGSSLALNRSLGFSGNFLSPVGNAISSNNRVESYLAKMQLELEKNINKELDQANAELQAGSARVSPIGSTAGSLRNVTVDQDPVSRATQQYLEVLKKNSKI